MKLSKDEIKKLMENWDVQINCNAKCDLCGHTFVPVLNIKDGFKKAKCPNCENKVYFVYDGE